jgi:hypothetical protein
VPEHDILSVSSKLLHQIHVKTFCKTFKSMVIPNLENVCQSMIYAGTESSASTVVWAMSELMVNPEIRKQVQEELDAVVGSERLVEESDLPSLPFLRAVVNLGNTMVTLMVAHLVHSFDWSLPAGVSAEALSMAEDYKLVNLRKEPLSLIAKPRSPAYLY